VAEGSSRIPIRLEVNGRPHTAEVEARRLLVHFIRDELGLTGTHVGCDTGSCGACTVIIDGRAVKSCMLLAPQADGCSLRTVEGLTREDGNLSPIQQAFHEAHALQCGYCTPGMLMSATYLLDRNGDPSDDEIKHAIQGNICRCTGYQNIIAAIRLAADRRES
jgi:aerobic carbon-monoxide dehydrogenase small subunit